MSECGMTWCPVEDCTKHRLAGMKTCREHGEFLECVTPGCKGRQYSAKLCKYCYVALDVRTCTVWWCPRPLYAVGICKYHYEQRRLKTKLDLVKRTAHEILKDIMVDSEKVSKLLASKEPQEIMDGLAELVKIQTERLAVILKEEDASGEHSKAADRLTNALFQQVVSLAKLRDPKLTGNEGGKHLHLHLRGQPKEVMAKAMAALEREGIPREEITEDMVIKYIDQKELNAAPS